MSLPENFLCSQKSLMNSDSVKSKAFILSTPNLYTPFMYCLPLRSSWKACASPAKEYYCVWVCCESVMGWKCNRQTFENKHKKSSIEKTHFGLYWGDNCILYYISILCFWCLCVWQGDITHLRCASQMSRWARWAGPCCHWGQQKGCDCCAGCRGSQAWGGSGGLRQGGDWICLPQGAGHAGGPGRADKINQ